jgi:hypothetical protein
VQVPRLPRMRDPRPALSAAQASDAGGGPRGQREGVQEDATETATRGRSSTRRWSGGASAGGAPGRMATGSDGVPSENRAGRPSPRAARGQAVSPASADACQPGSGSSHLTAAAEPTTTAKLTRRESRRANARWSYHGRRRCRPRRDRAARVGLQSSRVRSLRSRPTSWAAASAHCRPGRRRGHGGRRARRTAPGPGARRGGPRGCGRGTPPAPHSSCAAPPTRRAGRGR